MQRRRLERGTAKTNSAAMAKRGTASAERGAVTAELAIALPAVMLVVGLILAVGQWQLQQQRLLVSAATVARALARGEAQSLIDEWVARLPAQLEISYGSNLVCARLSQASALPGFDNLEGLKVSEEQCAEKQ